jgi:preprotein translocase YajC subunit
MFGSPLAETPPRRILEGVRLKIIEFIAQTAPTGAMTSKPAADPAPQWFTMLTNPMVLFGAVILISFMFMGKGKRTEEKQRQEMLKALKRGDRIQTIGGILGAVTKVEENRVEVKVDESSNTKMWFARSAIARVTDVEKTETK